MTTEQAARIAEIERIVTDAAVITVDDAELLLALIRDLERENASLRELASPVQGYHPEPGDENV